MNDFLVMTLIGADRPGLVQAVSALVEQHGGNWEESRMVHLAGQFAGLLSIEAPVDRIEALENALGALEGVSVTVSRGSRGAAEGGALRRLEVVGQDRPGIVRKVTEAVAGLGLNIEELETAVRSAPMSAELHFKAEALLRGPDAGAFDGLQDLLEQLGAELMVDLKEA